MAPQRCHRMPPWKFETLLVGLAFQKAVTAGRFAVPDSVDIRSLVNLRLSAFPTLTTRPARRRLRCTMRMRCADRLSAATGNSSIEIEGCSLD